MSKGYYREWYRENAEALRRRRRKRYRTDAAYRAACLARSRRRRKAAALARAASRPADGLLRPSEVARELGVSLAVLRSWDAKGYVPRGAKGTHRRYAPAQLEALMDLRDHLAEHGWRGKDPAVAGALEAIVQRIHQEAP